MVKKLIGFLFSVTILNAATLPVKEITDESIVAGQTVKWTADTVYLLKGIVYVDSGATLTIDPGTIVKASQEEGSSIPTCLVVAQYGKIFANGTRTKPVIFTAAADDPTNPYETTFEKVVNKPKGLWGGLVVFGNAKYNGLSDQNFINVIGNSDKRGRYGKPTSPIINENSGVLRYISIRYAGYNSEMATQFDYASKYLAGLTLGGVGSGTVVEYIDVYNSLQDGFQIFGGSVNCKYLSSTFNGRNGFYCADGWNGCGQYWFSNAGGVGDYGDAAVHKGDSVSSGPLISNVTYMFNQSNPGIHVINKASVHYFNAIINLSLIGLKLESESAMTNFTSGNISVQQSIFCKIGDQTTKPYSYDKQIGLWIYNTNPHTVSGGSTAVQDSMRKWGDTIAYPLFKSELNGNEFSKFPPALSTNFIGFDFRPAADTSYAIRDCNYDIFKLPKFNSMSGFIEPTSFIGAFDPWQDTCWLRSWTAVDHYGFLSKNDIRTTLKPKPTDTCGLEIVSRMNSKKSAEKINLSHLVCSNQLKVSLGLKSAVTNINISMFDLRGRCIASVYKGNISEGTHSFTINTERFISGQYLLRVNANHLSVSKIISIVK